MLVAKAASAMKTVWRIEELLIETEGSGSGDRRHGDGGRDERGSGDERGGEREGETLGGGETKRHGGFPWVGNAEPFGVASYRATAVPIL